MKYSRIVNRTKAYEIAREIGESQSSCMYFPGEERELEGRRITLKEYRAMAYCHYVEATA